MHEYVEDVTIFFHYLYAGNTYLLNMCICPQFLSLFDRYSVYDINKHQLKIKAMTLCSDAFCVEYGVLFDSQL